ncbi:MAG: mechanosensitive ion channel family protein [Burkholderiaceae bacterium]|nr:mechanosensitive ion channel family protein [Burkholderiaceae bacterium]
MNIESLWAFVTTRGVDLGLKVAGALALWIVGRWLIGIVTRLISAGMNRNRVDPTLGRYVVSIVGMLLTIVLVLGILGFFGVETTSFAALLAGAGLAIGTAWGGLLTHFAAGAFLLVLRPFKVGDFIAAGGATGTVREIGLFTTTIVGLDNVTMIVGNNRIFADNIQNFSALPYRRVDCLAKVANSVDPSAAIERLRSAIAAVPNVVSAPAPEIEILHFTPEGPMLAVRPFANNDHYWQVYFDTYRKIIEVFAAAGYPVPETPVVERRVQE